MQKKKEEKSKKEGENNFMMFFPLSTNSEIKRIKLIVIHLSIKKTLFNKGNEKKGKTDNKIVPQ